MRRGIAQAQARQPRRTPVRTLRERARHWALDGRMVYAIDYQPGLDVLRWNGPFYVPTK